MTEKLKNRDFGYFFTFINNCYKIIDASLLSNAIEKDYHITLVGILYGILNDMNIPVKSEESTSIGSMDIFFELDEGFYILELKYRKSAQHALNQINQKKYYYNYLNKDKSIFLIGINFTSDTHNISDWQVQCLSSSGKDMGIICESKSITPQQNVVTKKNTVPKTSPAKKNVPKTSPAKRAVFNIVNTI